VRTCAPAVSRSRDYAVTKSDHAFMIGRRSSIKTPRDVDLCTLPHVPTTCVHDLAGRLVCQKCKKAGKRPAATLLQLTPRSPSVAGRLNAKRYAPVVVQMSRVGGSSGTSELVARFN
jgi:hypothetical protein